MESENKHFYQGLQADSLEKGALYFEHTWNECLWTLMKNIETLQTELVLFEIVFQWHTYNHQIKLLKASALEKRTDTYKRSDSVLWIEKYSIEFFHRCDRGYLRLVQLDLAEHCTCVL